MKKSTKIQSIISIILIIAVIIFGVIAYLTAQRDITSKLKIIVSDKNVNVYLKAEAQWVSGDNANFETLTSSNGFEEDTWSLPNVEWVNFQSSPNAMLKIYIENKNKNEAHNLSFNISGLKYDNYSRFQTTVYHQVNGVNIGEITVISDINPIYKFTVPSTTDNVTIFVEYRLLKVNTNFNVPQNISISITQEAFA